MNRSAIRFHRQLRRRARKIRSQQETSRVLRVWAGEAASLQAHWDRVEALLPLPFFDTIIVEYEFNNGEL